MLRRRDRDVDGWSEEQRRRRGLRPLGRGLARGRDRDRRLASRRALRPAGRARSPGRTTAGRDRAARSPPSTFTPRSRRCSGACSSGTAVTAPPPASSIRTEQLEPFAEAFAAYADDELADDELRPVQVVDAIVPAARADARPRAGARPARARSGSGTPSDAARRRGRGGRAGHGRRRASISASASASTAATPAARSPSGSARSSIDFGRRASTTSLFRLKENRWNGTVAPQLVVRRVFDSPAGYEELRAWLAEQWRDGEAAWTPEAGRSSPSSDSSPAAVERELLESVSFRDAARARRRSDELPRAA